LLFEGRCKFVKTKKFTCMRARECYYFPTNNAFLQREGEVKMSNLEKNEDSGEGNNPENTTQNNTKTNIAEINKLLEGWVVNEIQGTRTVLFVCIILLLLVFNASTIEDGTAQKLLSIFFVFLLIILSFKKTKIIFDTNSVKKMSDYTFYLVIFWATMVIYHLSISNRFLLAVWSLTPRQVKTVIYFYLSMCVVLAILLCIIVPLILRKKYSKKGSHYYLFVTIGYLLVIYSFFANLLKSPLGVVCLIFIFFIYRQIVSCLSTLDREDISEYPDFGVESSFFVGKTTIGLSAALVCVSIDANKTIISGIIPFVFVFPFILIEHLLTYFLTKKYESVNNINKGGC